MVAAIPVLFAAPETNWGNYTFDPTVRAESAVAVDFAIANGSRTYWLFTLGRWACIPFSWIGALVCFSWARELYGYLSGLIALALWCSCPIILGNAALIMPDVPAAALAGAAAYAFARWLRRPAWGSAIVAGGITGLAQLAKTTLLVLFPAELIAWFIVRSFTTRRERCGALRGEAGMLCAQFLAALYLINAGYLFEGSFTRLGDFRFQSQLLAGTATNSDVQDGGNRFSRGILGCLPVPVPRNYVQGIDTQRLDFERGVPSYFRGEWESFGPWYFYLYALAIKLPIGTWIMLLLGTATAFVGRRARLTRFEIALVVLPIGLILTLVSTQTGVCGHLRYALPIFPFLYIWASRCGTMFRVIPPDAGACGVIPEQRRDAFGLTRTVSQRCSGKHRRVAHLFGALTGALALVWSIVASLSAYPHSLSYFNEIVGGPLRGHEHLLGSALNWGQDLLYLDEWFLKHRVQNPLRPAAAGGVGIGILAGSRVFRPMSPETRSACPRGGSGGSGDRGQILAVDVGALHPRQRNDGKRSAQPVQRPVPVRVPQASGGAPVLIGRAGYSYLIYRIDGVGVDSAGAH